jgi:uncharacterized membrane protein YhaH (DUF805 family)
MENINFMLIAPLFIIQLILTVIALIDLRKIHATNGPKWMWVLIIVFISTLGPIIYFIAGRKQ